MTDSSKTVMKMFWQTHLSKVKILVWIILITCAAVYYRTYPMRGVPAAQKVKIEKAAADRVRDTMLLGLEAELAQKYPQMTKEQKKLLIQARLEALLKEDPAKFRKISESVADKILGAHANQYTTQYLPEADPYYYFSLTRNIARTGRLGQPLGKRTFLNPLRHAPFGNPDFLNLHPYLGYFFFQFLRIFNPSLTLLTAVSFYPIFLSFVIILAFFLCSRTFEVSIFSQAMGCLMFILSSIVMQRTTYGWYDTDPYNLIFPLLILTTFFTALQKERGIVWLAAIGGVLSGFYSLFWDGWSFVLFLVVGLNGVLAFWEIFIFKYPLKKSVGLRYGSAYFFMTLTAAFFCLGSEGFSDSVKNSFGFIFKASAATNSYWPNLFPFVGETNMVTVVKWTFMISNRITETLAFLGIILGLWYAMRTKDRRLFRQWLVFFALFVPLFILSLKTERFVLLVVMPVAFFMILGTERLRGILESLLERFAGRKLPERYHSPIVFTLLFLLIVPRTLYGAEASARISHVIMNKAWAENMIALRDRSPQDATVISWWSPGYFVVAMANRRVVVDGGGQRHKENYWIARLFMSRNEKESCGIIRMLLSGGNESINLLETWGWSATRAVNFVTRIVVMSRERAKTVLPPDWSEEKKNQLLDLTHGRKDPGPTYVMVYDEMIKSNVMYQVISNWDFDRARQILGRMDKLSAVTNFFTSAGMRYAKEMFKITGQPLPYQGIKPLLRREGDDMYFENGARINLKTKQAFLKLKGPAGEQWTPVNLCYPEGEGWVELKSPVPTPILAVFLPQGKGSFSMLVHENLAATLLYRLFFFNAYGLQFFKPFSSGEEPNTETVVKVFEVDWPAFLNSLE